MKEPLLQEEDPGLPPVINLPRPSSKPIAPEPHVAPLHPSGSDLRSHFVFGPGFTQVLLLVCILMLGIVIGMKVSDYFHERNLEKSELALYRASQGARPQTVDPVPPPVLPQPQALPQVVAPSQLKPPPLPEVAQPTASPVTAQIQPRAQSAGTVTGAPAGRGPNYDNELALLQQERDLMRQQFDSLKSPSPRSSNQTEAVNPPAEPAAPVSGLPEARQPAPASSPAAPAAPKEETSAAEKRIREAPALGKVLEYDADWHFVVISCGSEHNLGPGRKLAIRRGGTLLGLIHLDEILPQQSVAELEGAWKTDAKATKPQPGDDVITFPPF
jgi:hypothetical protein